MSIRVILEKKKRADVVPSYDHVVSVAKEKNISEKEALISLTTKLDPEEAEGWLKRQKEKIAKGEKPLEEIAEDTAATADMSLSALAESRSV